MPDHTVDRLLKNIAAGDLKSFEKLHALFYLELSTCVLGLIRSKEDAEEIVSDIFIYLWVSKEKLINIQNARSYLFTMARNRSINYLRRVTTSGQLLAQQEINETLPVVNDICPGIELEIKELEKKISSVINDLPDQCRTIFLLVREKRMKYKEVAETLQISHRTVETQLVRAQKKIRNAIGTFLIF